jgi:riboflavin synthase alpha subunit
MGAAHQRAQSGRQLQQVHRLDQVIVGAIVQSGDAVGQLAAGDRVNVEFDILAKYLDRAREVGA